MRTRKELSRIFDSEEEAIRYLIAENIIQQPEKCIKCQYYNITRRSKCWRCSNSVCRKEWSIFNKSQFSKTKLQVNEFLEMCYYWLVGLKHNQICTITGISHSTITYHMKYLRKLASTSLDFIDLKIGGEGIIVEIDESKLGKNKHHRGHPVNGAWVLGGVERTENRKLFLVEVPDRKEATLLGIITTYVLPGSIIYTDCFKSYQNLQNLYEHHTVNHTETFINLENGACTNTIEGTWSALKYRISPRNRTNSFDDNGEINENTIDDFLAEFIWRRKYKDNLWDGFLNSLKNVIYE